MHVQTAPGTQPPPAQPESTGTPQQQSELTAVTNQVPTLQQQVHNVRTTMLMQYHKVMHPIYDANSSTFENKMDLPPSRICVVR